MEQHKNVQHVTHCQLCDFQIGGGRGLVGKSEVKIGLRFTWYLDLHMIVKNRFLFCSGTISQKRTISVLLRMHQDLRKTWTLICRK